VTSTDELALRDCLAHSPHGALGTHAIAEIKRSRFELITSYDAYRLEVALAGGGGLRLFLKDYGKCLRRKNDLRERREREVFVYRDLLENAGLGTARYFGSVMDESAGRFWMLLEYVEGTPVGYGPPGDLWVQAAEGLGRMHAHFAPDSERLWGCTGLIRHDPEFFLSTAERALRDVATIAPHLVRRIERWVRGYDRLVADMTSLPATLVQGGCRSSNILVGIAGEPERVCILDWEEASVGAGLFDVAHLADGLQSPLLHRLLEGYRRGAEATGVKLPSLADMTHLYECFRLHIAFNSLSRGVFHGYQEGDVAKLLDYADGIGRAIHAAPRERPSPSPRELERVVSKAAGRRVEIGGWRSERSPVAVRGVFPIEVLRVSLTDGEMLEVFVKRLGPEEDDHPDKARRDREPRLYEDWFQEDDLPVPRYTAPITTRGRCEPRSTSSTSATGVSPGRAWTAGTPCRPYWRDCMRTSRHALRNSAPASICCASMPPISRPGQRERSRSRGGMACGRIRSRPSSWVRRRRGDARGAAGDARPQRSRAQERARRSHRTAAAHFVHRLGDGRRGMRPARSRAPDARTRPPRATARCAMPTLPR
jgi:aminoglycoside phosphotransferase (APT) family kinase protein